MKYKSHTKDKRKEKLSDQVDRMLIHAKVSQNPSLMKSLENDQDPEKVEKEKRKHTLRKVNDKGGSNRHSNPNTPNKGVKYSEKRDERENHEAVSLDKQEMIENEMEMALLELDYRHGRNQQRYRNTNTTNRNSKSKRENSTPPSHYSTFKERKESNELMWSFLEEPSMISNANSTIAKSFLNRSLNFKTMLALNDDKIDYDDDTKRAGYGHNNNNKHGDDGDINIAKEREKSNSNEGGSKGGQKEQAKTHLRTVTNSSNGSPSQEEGYYELKGGDSSLYDDTTANNDGNSKEPRKSLTIDTSVTTTTIGPRTQANASFMRLLADPEATPAALLCDCVFLAGK